MFGIRVLGAFENLYALIFSERIEFRFEKSKSMSDCELLCTRFARRSPHRHTRLSGFNGKWFSTNPQKRCFWHAICKVFICEQCSPNTDRWKHRNSNVYDTRWRIMPVKWCTNLNAYQIRASFNWLLEFYLNTFRSDLRNKT